MNTTTVGLAELTNMREKLNEDLSILTRAIRILGGSDSNNGGTAVATRTYVARVPDTQRIEKVIMEMKGNFGASNIAEAVSKSYPDENFGPSAVPNTINKLTQNNQLKVLVPKAGRRGAVYQVS